MKTLYKIIVLIFLIPFISNAHEKDGKYTKNKVINKEFTVNSNALLNVSNKYGNIVISSWNENRIAIKVSITTNGNDEEKVKKRLEQIDVEFKGTLNNVSAKTVIEKSSSSWSFFGNKSNVNMEINYLIQMPISNSINLNNDYGSITIDKIEGSSKINCDYGKITIGELLNSDNNINIDYTNNSNIDFMKEGNINADYSTLNIDRSDNVELNADYSHISFGKIDKLNFNCDYGSLKIKEVNNIIGNCDYMQTIISKVGEIGNFDMDYGNIKINELGKDLKNLQINTSYTQIKIGVSPINSFKINASLSYGNFKKVEGFTFNKEIQKSSSKYYEGYFNLQNSTSTVSVKSNYGNLTFYNN